MIIEPSLDSFGWSMTKAVNAVKKTTADFRPAAGSTWGVGKGGMSHITSGNNPYVISTPALPSWVGQTWGTGKALTRPPVPGGQSFTSIKPNPIMLTAQPASSTWMSRITNAIKKLPVSASTPSVVPGGAAGALARIMEAKPVLKKSTSDVWAGQQASMQGFDAFGENDAYCDTTYPRGINAEIDAYNTKCKKGATLTNPAALSPPWTTLGKNARGLPGGDLVKLVEDAVAAGKGLLPGSKPPSGAPNAPGGPGALPPGYTSGGLTNMMSSPYFIPVALAAVAGVAFFVMKKRR